jgi:arginyl-tRNA synthetase
MIEQLLTDKVKEAVNSLYNLDADPSQIQLQNTRKEFDGDITLVVFPFTKVSRKSPEATASEIGEYLILNLQEVESFNVIKGFLNISVKKDYWLNFLGENYLSEKFGFTQSTDEKPVVVEFSSPNTNKPLHLGHIRNNLLGFSLSRILQASGKNVVKVNLVNDRGIHICKSMLAWRKWGKFETPKSSKLKGDHLVGKYYVKFEQKLVEKSINEIKKIIRKGVQKQLGPNQYMLSFDLPFVVDDVFEYNKFNEILSVLAQLDDLSDDLIRKEDGLVDLFKKNSSLLKEAQQMLQKWEAGDDRVISLWQKMNKWVYKGFEETYQTLGIEFDEIYYESKTYLLGKTIVQEGLNAGKLFRKEDSSVWINLTEEGLDEKLLLRSDGTSVYMTQDLGTACQRYKDFSNDKNDTHPEQLIYVVGNEQEYHFQVLRLALKHLGYNWYDSIYHLSYGMVELPAGKMKSREGTVVDADDLMQEMFDTSEAMARELGKIESFDDEEAKSLYRTIGLGALKYFILKVDPKKNMLFNPAESVDFNGNTGPFIQYTYARIKSVLRKADEAGFGVSMRDAHDANLMPQEKELLKKVHDFPAILVQSADMHSPAMIANYAFELASEYNRFYHDLTILKEENRASRALRLSLSKFTAQVISNSLWLLGIEVPERM